MGWGEERAGGRIPNIRTSTRSKCVIHNVSVFSPHIHKVVLELPRDTWYDLVSSHLNADL